MALGRSPRASGLFPEAKSRIGTKLELPPLTSSSDPRLASNSYGSTSFPIPVKTRTSADQRVGKKNSRPVKTQPHYPARTTRLASSRPRLLQHHLYNAPNYIPVEPLTSADAIEGDHLERPLETTHLPHPPDKWSPSRLVFNSQPISLIPRARSSSASEMLRGRSAFESFLASDYSPTEKWKDTRPLVMGETNSVIRFTTAEAREASSSHSPESHPSSPQSFSYHFTANSLLLDDHSEGSCCSLQWRDEEAIGDVNGESDTRKGPSQNTRKEHQGIDKKQNRSLSEPILDILADEGYDGLKQVLSRAKQKAPSMVDGDTALVDHSLHADVSKVLQALGSI